MDDGQGVDKDVYYYSCTKPIFTFTLHTLVSFFWLLKFNARARLIA